MVMVRTPDGKRINSSSGDSYFTKDYSHIWDHKPSGSWSFNNNNTKTSVATDKLGDAPYEGGTAYGPFQQLFVVSSGAYAGDSVYITDGAAVYYSSGRLIEMKSYDNSSVHLSRDQYWTYYGSTQQIYEWYENTYLTNGTKTNEVDVFYSQGGATRTAPWLSGLGVQAPTGSIILTETWNLDSNYEGSPPMRSRLSGTTNGLFRTSKEIQRAIVLSLPRLTQSKRLQANTGTLRMSCFTPN